MRKSYAAYVRISAEDKRVGNVSPDVQIASIHAWARLKGVEIAEIVIDRGVSGFKPLNRRKGGKKLLEYVAAHKCGIVVMKIDRAFRRVSDAARNIETWNQTGVHFASVTEGFEVGTPLGFAFAVLAVVFAQLERDHSSARNKSSKEHLKSIGRTTNGSPPYGWRVGAGNLLEVDPVEDQTRRRILRLNSFGNGPGKIAAILNHERVSTRKGGPWLKSTVRQILVRAGRMGGKADDAGDVAGNENPSGDPENGSGNRPHGQGPGELNEGNQEQAGPG